MKTLVGLVALALSVALFALALLVLLPAPSYNLWKLQIIVTECGHFVAPVALLTLLVWRRSVLSRTAAIVAAVAACILFVPAMSAVRVLHAMPEPRPSTARFLLSLYTGGEKRQQHRTLAIPAGDTVLRADFYAAANASPAQVYAPPLVVMIHGGSWQGGNPAQLAALNWRLTRRGYAVAAITYRFAPRDTFPTQLQDVRSQVAWLREHAAELGFDPEKVVMMGRSAGGQLALLSAYIPERGGIVGAISFYAPTDLTWGYEHPSQSRVHPSRSILSEYLGGAPDTHAGKYASASPISYVASDVVPTLLVHGAADELVFVEHAERLAAELLLARRPATLITLPWATHGCDYIVRGPCYQISALAVDAFLEQLFARSR
jgi:acetyl esterase/lipase